MEIMHNYADLLTEIEIIKDQIQLTEEELENWSFDGKYGMKFGVNTSIIQSDKKLTSLEKLHDRLHKLEDAKERLETLFKRFEGLDYKIAYKRIVEGKTHQEIAIELGYSHDYIREKWSKIKSHKEPTEMLLKS